MHVYRLSTAVQYGYTQKVYLGGWNTRISFLAEGYETSTGYVIPDRRARASKQTSTSSIPRARAFHIRATKQP